MEEMYGESLGILKNYRVLNVAITRAKYGLICVGNADVLSKGSKDFNAFIHIA
jgi:superfamily I DNA and/or RNA helicase